MHFNRTSKYFGKQAIGHDNVRCMTAPKPKNRPPRAEFTIRHRHILAAAKERAGVILAFHSAVADVHVRRADEMKSIVIVVDAAMNMNPREPRVIALDHADGMIRAVL